MDRWAEWMDSLVSRWNSLESYVRQFVVAITVFAVCGFAMTTFLSMRKESASLENALLKLQVAQARMAEDAATAKLLLTRPEAMQTAVVADVPGIQTLAGEGVSVTVAPGGGFRLMSASIPYAKWWALCAELDRRFGLTMSALELAPKQDVKQNVSFDMTVTPGRSVSP